MKNTETAGYNRIIARLLFVSFMALGILVRTLGFGDIPGGINQDEAFAAYEAWSLLEYGIDTAGYSYPIYLTAWGSGMNALETYLMMPFIALFGLETWAIRLPQLIVALLSLWTAYLMVKRMCGEKAALCALFMLAICPWHVLLSRWGLESNLAPGFLLFGMYFFLRGLDDSRFLLLAAFMYGLSLYTYATIWPLVPMVLLLQFVYTLYCGKIRVDRNVFFSVLILAVMAVPLLLFLAVNFGYIPEIRLPFMSVPRLLYMRAGEMSFSNIGENLKKLIDVVVTQNDGLIWNTAGNYGLFYKFSLPFALLGMGNCIYGFACGLRLKRFYSETLLLIQFIAGVFLGAMVSVNVNRVNIIFFPLIIFTALGIFKLCLMTRKELILLFAAMYMTVFVCFQSYYFNDYRRQIAGVFNYGLEDALNAAEQYDGKTYLSDEYLYPVVLFYTQMPVDEFRDTVKYVRYPAAYLKAERFGPYSYDFDPTAPEDEGVYLLSPWEDKSAFEDEGFSFEYYGYCTLAVKKGQK